MLDNHHSSEGDRSGAQIPPSPPPPIEIAAQQPQQDRDDRVDDGRRLRSYHAKVAALASQSQHSRPDPVREPTRAHRTPAKSGSLPTTMPVKRRHQPPDHRGHPTASSHDVAVDFPLAGDTPPTNSGEGRRAVDDQQRRDAAVLGNSLQGVPEERVLEATRRTSPRDRRADKALGSGGGGSRDREAPVPFALARLVGVEGVERMESDQPGAFSVLPSSTPDHVRREYFDAEEGTWVRSNRDDFLQLEGDSSQRNGPDDSIVMNHHRQDDEADDEVPSLGGDFPLATYPTLVEASLVTEPTLVEAEQVTLMTSTSDAAANNKTFRKKWMRWLILGLLLAVTVGIVAGVTLALAAPISSRSSSSSSSSSSSQQDSDEAMLRAALPNYTVDALQNPGSAPFLALQWARDDGAFLSTVPPEDRFHRLFQRYVLALLAFAALLDPRYPPDIRTWQVHTTSECSWYGCGCTDQDVVQEVSVPGAGLVGVIAPEFALLSDLESLNLGNNSFSGTIPTEIGALTRLTDFRLDQTRLSGSLPSEIGVLTELTTLILSSTRLDGTVPSEFGSLSSLSLLDLSNIPLLRGVIPQGLCQRVANQSLTIIINCTAITCDCDCICQNITNR
jgi:Leucine-rich repeat (LRR) protein